MPTNFIPPLSYGIGTPDIGVEIWPHEGGSFTFYGSKTGIISAEIHKDIRDKDGGKFIINIAPGGPKGVNDNISWTQILTPLSLVIITLSRAGSKRIVMIGVIYSCAETQSWSKQGARRVTQIIGGDFTYFFSSFSYYTMAYLGIQGQAGLDAAPIGTGPGGFIAGASGKLFIGSPAEVGDLWINDIMLGPAPVGTTPPDVALAVLQQTYIMYQNQKIFLYQFIGHWFEAFIENGQGVAVPYLSDVLNSEGTWFDKFLAIFPPTNYEFFVTTAATSDYPGISSAAGNNNSTSPKATFDFINSFASIPSQTINVQGFNTVSPLVIARVNPLPWLTYGKTGSISDYTLTQDRWQALPTFSLGTFGFIESKVEYNTEDISNFFVVSGWDTNAVAQSQGNTDANAFAMAFLGGIVAHYSINTYGFRPKTETIRWLTFLAKIGFPQLKNLKTSVASVLLGKLASFYLPTPNMLKGSVSFPLWPDVLPGNKFTYTPYKNNDSYEFYIEGVTHIYEFAGESMTILTLDRGMKLNDYNDPTILTGVMADTYVRQNGILVQRSDLATTVGAYYVDIATSATLPGGILASPYYSGPPTIKPNTSGSGPTP